MNASTLPEPHWMLQEILEQPEVVRTCLKTWAIASNSFPTLETFGLADLAIASIQQVRIVGCGTSLHAGWVGKLLLEDWAKLPTALYPASELRHTLPPALSNTLTIAITQSGETTDVLKGCLQLQAQDAQAQISHSIYIGITNQRGSSLAGMTQAMLITPAGSEVSIAATKTFTATLIMLYGLVLAIAQQRGTLSREECQQITQSLHQLPGWIAQVLDTSAQEIAAIAAKWQNYRNCIIVGRGVQAAIAAEAALKLKEAAYIHAEGFAAGEFLHGPIALLDESIPVVAIAIPGSTFEGVLGTLPKLKSRGSPLLVITTASNVEDVQNGADECIVLPDVPEAIAPVLTILPLQLLAYHWALNRQLNPDQPRGLVKSISKD